EPAAPIPDSPVATPSEADAPPPLSRADAEYLAEALADALVRFETDSTYLRASKLERYSTELLLFARGEYELAEQSTPEQAHAAGLRADLSRLEGPIYRYPNTGPTADGERQANVMPQLPPCVLVVRRDEFPLRWALRERKVAGQSAAFVDFETQAQVLALAQRAQAEWSQFLLELP
ncbi:MAG TPA: hypothetical protein VJP77_08920, partial [Planctomycetota bacterium]|nr:hypothetical protein [Planctomycetota bacterium]